MSRSSLVTPLNIEDFDVPDDTKQYSRSSIGNLSSAQALYDAPHGSRPSVIDKAYSLPIVGVVSATMIALLTPKILAFADKHFSSIQVVFSIGVVGALLLLHQRIASLERAIANMNVSQSRQVNGNEEFPEIIPSLSATSSPDVDTTRGPIRAGVYLVARIEEDSAIDLSGDDGRTVIGYKIHKGNNQKWEFSPMGAGYSIKCVGPGTYLSCEKEQEGATVVAALNPVSWDITMLSGK
ncbi:hypothetical protein CONPUDRAFT_100750, partial [Coniophora puteana RWD-64-598 SS2]